MPTADSAQVRLAQGQGWPSLAGAAARVARLILIDINRAGEALERLSNISMPAQASAPAVYGCWLAMREDVAWAKA